MDKITVQVQKADQQLKELISLSHCPMNFGLAKRHENPAGYSYVSVVGLK